MEQRCIHSTLFATPVPRWTVQTEDAFDGSVAETKEPIICKCHDPTINNYAYCVIL